MKISKRIKKNIASYDKSKLYSIEEAVGILKNSAMCKFDESVDIAMNMNIDPKKSDQALRGVVEMPNGTGKSVRIAVFAKGEKAAEAKAAGADIVGDLDLIERIEAGNIDFDLCIATPDVMGSVGKVGKLLGPKGLMPNPKLGTVTLDVKLAVERARRGQVEFKAEKSGIIHAGICKISFANDKIIENLKAFMAEVVKLKPISVKGTYIKGVTLSTTMGCGVDIDLANI